MRKMLPRVKGADMARAHGQAIISTAVKTFKATVLSAIHHQYAVEAVAMSKIITVKYWLMVSVSVLNESCLSLLNTSLLHN